MAFAGVGFWGFQFSVNARIRPCKPGLGSTPSAVHLCDLVIVINKGVLGHVLQLRGRA